MQRENRPGNPERDPESDVERVLDELYVTAPTGFVARRAELAAEAKADGRVADARRIRAARRPTLAAWAANLLLRSQPADSRRFLELGQALRTAYRTLDADEIKELSQQRGRVVSALAGQAAALARDAGHRLSDAAGQEVVSTLRAVLADQGAADLWAAGRLESSLTPPVDFPTDLTTGLTTGPATDLATGLSTDLPTAAPASTPTDELAERRTRRKREELAAARQAAARADRLLRRERAEQQDTDAALGRARERHDRARADVAAAEERLRRARAELEPAELEQHEAEERDRAAADATARAERAAQDAAREVRRLSE
ncbi:hypothetical protein [Streptomyces boluensis]|uniref:Uncharacterized protein n=1 Tax=Streptomyces boluensis TaxID=1775135 RepID=A0A964UM44_9ACTN|nr:hypothetical protein [Streptomyces boluensis]NBE50660.1 hypothetical protein [Streptomyces boluensis]